MGYVYKGEEYLPLGRELFFHGANGDACSVLSEPPDSYDAPSKAAGSRACSYYPSSRCIFFFLSRVPLLANTLIITSLGNVHTQELLVTDSTHFSISHRVTAENGMHGFFVSGKKYEKTTWNPKSTRWIKRY